MTKFLIATTVAAAFTAVPASAQFYAGAIQAASASRSDRLAWELARATAVGMTGIIVTGTIQTDTGPTGRPIAVSFENGSRRQAAG